MQQETANELVGGQGHRFDLAVVPIVLPLEADLTVFYIEQTVVGNRDAVRITAYVIEDLLRSGERPLGVHYPLAGLHASYQLGKDLGFDERTPGRQRIVICQNRRPSATTPGTGVGTGARAPGQAKRNPVCRIPSSDHPVTIPRSEERRVG